MSSTGQREALADRMNRLEEDLREAQQQANALRRTNAALEQRLERKDSRIGELLEEKFALADQLRQQQGQPQQQTTQDFQPQTGQAATLKSEEEASHTASTPQPVSKPRKPGVAFTLVPFDARKVEKGKKDATAYGLRVPDLRQWAAERRPSKIKPKILSDVPWVLSMVPEEERTAHKKLREEFVALAEGDEDDAPDGKADTPTSPISSPDTRRSIKRRRLDSERPAFESRRDSFAFARFISATEIKDEEDRDAGPPYLHRQARPRMFRRKAVCVHCWTTKQYCDFLPQCESCRTDGVRCIRKLCELGERCNNYKCPCLHAGDWDETDPGYTVEEGRMPRKWD